jgi:hypothetical protein
LVPSDPAGYSAPLRLLASLPNNFPLDGDHDDAMKEDEE